MPKVCKDFFEFKYFHVIPKGCIKKIGHLKNVYVICSSRDSSRFSCSDLIIILKFLNEFSNEGVFFFSSKCLLQSFFFFRIPGIINFFLLSICTRTLLPLSDFALCFYFLNLFSVMVCSAFVLNNHSLLLH